MVTEVVQPVSQPYSTIAEAVDIGFGESGLAAKVATEGGAVLLKGLQGYIVVMLGAFIHRDAMYGRYQKQRAMFAALVEGNYFDAIFGQIQEGDLALFHGGLFFGGVYRLGEAAGAKKAYSDVAVLLRGNRNEHRFFVFLSQNTLPVMDGLGLAAMHLNLPRPKETLIAVPSLEKYLGRG